jgi:hypothetical protein
MGLIDLFRPKWKHPDIKIRGEAVEKLTDQSILARIAKTDESWIRLKAVINPNFTDQKLLAEIAFSDEYPRVRESAVKKLIDQKLIAEIAKTAQDRDMRETAVGKLTDQKLLADIAGNDVDPGVCEAAVRNRNFTNQKLLAGIIKTNQHSSVREAAVANITDKDLLAEVALNDNFPRVREAAVRNPSFTDQNLLADILRTDKRPGVRRCVIMNPNFISQELLAEFAHNDPDSSVRIAAATKITDYNLLLYFIRTSNDPLIVSIIIKGLQKISPMETEQEIKALCSTEHCFSEYKDGARYCVRCGSKEKCPHQFYSAWEKAGPDDRGRYSWRRMCEQCSSLEVVHLPPKDVL